MTAGGWEALAIQAPIVLIFAGAIYLLLKMQSATAEKMMGTFMTFLEKRDAELNKALEHIAECLDAHDDRSRAHDAYVHERFKDLIE